MRHEAEAKRVQAVIDRLQDMLPGKVQAYGAAHEVQPRLWSVLLQPYRQTMGGYLIPPHIVQQVPRLTRCLDRIIRIVNAPEEGDLLGESAWLDLAGDAIAGQATMDAFAPDTMSTGPSANDGCAPPEGPPEGLVAHGLEGFAVTVDSGGKQRTGWIPYEAVQWSDEAS